MQVEKFSTWLCGYDSSCIRLIILVCNSARILINPFNQQTWMNFSMFIKQKELLSLWRMICRFWFHMRTLSGIGRMRKPWGPPLRLVSSHPPEIDPSLSPSWIARECAQVFCPLVLCLWNWMLQIDHVS